jgi:hypothetical protein
MVLDTVGGRLKTQIESQLPATVSEGDLNGQDHPAGH